MNILRRRLRGRVAAADHRELGRAAQAEADELGKRIGQALAEGRLAEAEADTRAVLTEQAGTLGEPFFTAMECRMLVLGRLGEHAKAAREGAGLIAAARPVLSGRDVSLLRWQISRAAQLTVIGQYGQAEKELRAVIGQAGRAWPPRSRAGIKAFAACGLILALDGRGLHAEAESCARSAMHEAMRSIPMSRSALVYLRIGLARSLNAQERYEEAEQCLQDLKPLPYESIPARYVLAVARLGLGKAADAETGAREAAATAAKLLGPPHYLNLEIGTLTGTILARTGRLDEAESQLQVNVAAWEEHFGYDHVKAAAARAELARVRGQIGE